MTLINTYNFYISITSDISVLSAMANLLVQGHSEHVRVVLIAWHHVFSLVLKRLHVAAGELTKCRYRRAMTGVCALQGLSVLWRIFLQSCLLRLGSLAICSLLQLGLVSRPCASSACPSRHDAIILHFQRQIVKQSVSHLGIQVFREWNLALLSCAQYGLSSVAVRKQHSCRQSVKKTSYL